MSHWRAVAFIILIVQFVVAAFMIRLDYELDQNRDETLRNRAFACINRVLNKERFDYLACNDKKLLKYYTPDIRKVITNGG